MKNADCLRYRLRSRNLRKDGSRRTFSNLIRVPPAIAATPTAYWPIIAKAAGHSPLRLSRSLRVRAGSLKSQSPPPLP